MVVSGTTQTVGLLTATGGVSSPGAVNASGGATVSGGLSTDTITSSGNANLQGTTTLQTVNAAAITTSGNFRSNGNLSCTSGTTTLGGPVNISGATTMAALTASSSSIAGNETVGGTLGVTGATTLGTTSTGALTASSASVTNALTASSASFSANTTVGGTLGVTGATTLGAITAGALTASSSSIAGSETVAATLTAKNLTLTNGGGGVLTFADGTTMATAATSSGTTSSSSSTSSTTSAGAIDTFFMGTFNNAGTNFPTAYTSADAYFVNAQYSAQGAASRSGCAYTATYAGNVYSIQGYCVSQTSATVNIGLYKNGTFTNLQAATTGGAYYATPSSALTVAVGDVLQFFVKSTSSTTSTPLVGWMSLQQNAVIATTAHSVVDMGYYWPGSSSYPTALTANTLTLTTTNSTSVATVPKFFGAAYSGNVVAIQAYLYGTTGGKAYTWTLYKNGTATALTVSTSATAAGVFYSSNSSVAFSAGDTLQVYTSAASGATPQSTSASITITSN